MQDAAVILKFSTSLTIIKLIETHKVLNNIGKMIYGSMMMLQIRVGLQKLRHSNIVWRVVFYANWRFFYFYVGELLPICLSFLLVDRLELMPDFEKLQYSPVDFVRTLEHLLHNSICAHCPHLFITLIGTAGRIIWEELRRDWAVTNGKITHLSDDLSLAATKQTQNRNRMLSLSLHEFSKVQLSFDLCRSHVKLLSIA